MAVKFGFQPAKLRNFERVECASNPAGYPGRPRIDAEAADVDFPDGAREFRLGL